MQCAVATCRGAVASIDVRAEPVLVVFCDVRAVHFQACEVRPQYRTFFGNSFTFCSSKMKDFSNFSKKAQLLGNYMEGVGN